MNAYEITALRHALGLTRERFAALLGVTLGTVGNWERGKSHPTGLSVVALDRAKKQLEKAVKALDKPPDVV